MSAERPDRGERCRGPGPALGERERRDDHEERDADVADHLERASTSAARWWSAPTGQCTTCRRPRPSVPEDHEARRRRGRRCARSERSAQVAAAEREPDEQVREPDERGVSAGPSDERRAGVPVERGARRSTAPAVARGPRTPRPRRAAARGPAAATTRPRRTARRTSAGSRRRACPAATRSIAEDRRRSARTTMRTRAWPSARPGRPASRRRTAAPSERPASTTNSADGRPSASCANPPGPDRVVRTDVRGHHPEHGEASGHVDPHDPAHARMLASSAGISHVETVCSDC